jgi:hypothetical protein
MTIAKLLTDERNNPAGTTFREEQNVAVATRNSPALTRARGVPFKKGNPGKPKGARSRVTQLAERLVEGEAEEIVRSIIASAKSGNPAAIAAVARILLPERRGRSVAIENAGDLERSATSLAQVTQAVLSSALNGVISAEEAQQFGIIIAAAARAYELESLEHRVIALESERNGK